MAKKQDKELYKFVNGKRVVSLKERSCEYCASMYQPRTKKNRFCSMSCYWKFRVGKPSTATWSVELRERMSQERSGKGNGMYGKACWNKGLKLPEMSGENHPRYKGGWIQCGYHYMTINGKQTPAHRHIFALTIDRPLENHEVVHHINGDKLDNRIENLMLLTRAEHIKLHRHEINRWSK